MLKVFISMGFKGRDEEFIFKRRSSIEKILNNLFVDYRVIDNYTKDIPDVINESVWCLGDSIRLMADADIIVFDEDYKNFGGCLIEEKIAKRYEMFRMYL